MIEKILYIPVLAFICMMSFSSCEEQPVDIPEFTLPVSDRIVLIEELTGVNCPNCPAGSAKVNELIDLYDGSLVGYGNHGSFLAEPITGSKYDFRSQEGVELENYLSPFLGKPAAIINREQFEEESFWSITTIDLWQSYIERQFDKPVLLNITLNTSFDEVTREATIEVIGIPIEDLEGDIKLSVVLTESHIVDPQKDQNEIIEEFEHMHVLRDIVTSNVSGDLMGSNVAKNEILTKSFTVTLPPEDGTWIHSNMEVIAFFTQHIGGTEEVLQASGKHL